MNVEGKIEKVKAFVPGTAKRRKKMQVTAVALKKDKEVEGTEKPAEKSKNDDSKEKLNTAESTSPAPAANAKPEQKAKPSAPEPEKAEPASNLLGLDYNSDSDSE